MPRVSEIDGDRGDPTLQPIFARDRELFGGPSIQKGQPLSSATLRYTSERSWESICVIAANPAVEGGIRR